MWLFLSVLAICITYYLASRFGVPLVRLEVLVAPAVGQPVTTPPSGPEPAPEAVLMFCAQESEPHAREAMLRKAFRLREELGDWDSVLRTLQAQEGE